MHTPKTIHVAELGECHYEHRDARSQHTVIWTEDSQHSISITVMGHLTEGHVRSILDAYLTGFFAGRRHQAHAVKKLMKELLEGGPYE